ARRGHRRPGVGPLHPRAAAIRAPVDPDRARRPDPAAGRAAARARARPPARGRDPGPCVRGGRGMRALRGVQRDLHAFLLGEADAAERHVLGNERLSARQRLRGYAGSYRIRPREALADDFKAVRAWLGPARFAELADAYLRRHPSRHYSLRWFGRHFARFLGAAPPWRDTPLLAELAAFE